MIVETFLDDLPFLLKDLSFRRVSEQEQIRADNTISN